MSAASSPSGQRSRVRFRSNGGRLCVGELVSVCDRDPAQPRNAIVNPEPHVFFARVLPLDEGGPLGYTQTGVLLSDVIGVDG